LLAVSRCRKANTVFRIPSKCGA